MAQGLIANIPTWLISQSHEILLSQGLERSLHETQPTDVTAINLSSALNLTTQGWRPASLGKSLLLRNFPVFAERILRAEIGFYPHEPIEQGARLCLDPDFAPVTLQ